MVVLRVSDEIKILSYKGEYVVNFVELIVILQLFPFSYRAFTVTTVRLSLNRILNPQ